MKKVLVHLLILIPLISFSQNWKIPKIDWEGEIENKYVELLKLTDSNSLIVKIGTSSYWSKGLSSDFIVYQNDGTVKRFVVFQPYSNESKTEIKHKRIAKKDYPYYWNHLNSCIEKKTYKIDKSKLNITEKEGEKKGTVESMIISDGVNYHFWICQGKNYIAYGSYAPITYIKNKYPGYEERQKLVDLIDGFQKLTEKH